MTLPSFDPCWQPKREMETCFSGGEHLAGNWMPYECRCGEWRCEDCDGTHVCESCTDYVCPECLDTSLGYSVHKGECLEAAQRIEREENEAAARIARGEAA